MKILIFIYSPQEVKYLRQGKNRFLNLKETRSKEISHLRKVTQPQWF